MRRVAVGGIAHETHTFAPSRTDLDAFARQALYEGEALLGSLRGTSGALGGALEGRARGLSACSPVVRGGRAWRPRDARGLR